MASKDQPSTLKSYIDSATATVQSAIGSTTGNPNDKTQADLKKQNALDERTASQTGAKVGPLSFSNTGETTVDNQDRRQGAWDETVGSVKKAVGNLTGNAALKDAGARQEQEGQEQKAAGQIKDLTSGAADRVAGTIGSGMASLTKNTEAQADFQKQHDQGKTRVRGVEAELNSQQQ
ncbi:hypothetical protein L211DRAFT_837654 [Terfezia boudieri ATCC MYA-4762]|uniref:CsbD-like domain-containing protein n=1 Tax=Terfezia boudieri ATCC MYA-4762 TaxID=1051890 RepID=A0A3N4LUE7_9PEZI|nr:hypothetical protein L211DRAFT_837654 [Terfezia boudieri ATCC MYA-4762]